MLSADSRDFLERRLVSRATQLRQHIAELRARREEGTLGEVTDRKDVAAAGAEAVVTDAEIESDLAQLRDIRSARRRLQDGGYGSCVDCGEVIDTRRLLAEPQVLRCVSCQQRAEHAERRAVSRGGHPRLA